MSVAVIGAGWAGLSAALTLKAAGCEVTVYESSHQPGGRARAVQTPNVSQATDNGQHILLGAYTDTLKLMQSCDVDISTSLHRAPLCLTTPNNKFHFRLSHRLRGKAGMLADLLGAQGLSWRSKYYLARALYRLERSGWRIQSDTATLSQWLHRQKQTRAACKYFWYPLCLAALNTHPDEADAQIMANVLRDSLGSRRSDATDILIANNLLETLWPTQACNHLALQLSTPIRRIRYTENT
ncbi:MAG: FAD-dependent oxidoreductase, partial [Pusillimonas sp.]|nr:FAD-dependent oxidoreductase [Pusillimonas sp.]